MKTTAASRSSRFPERVLTLLVLVVLATHAAAQAPATSADESPATRVGLEDAVASASVSAPLAAREGGAHRLMDTRLDAGSCAWLRRRLSRGRARPSKG